MGTSKRYAEQIDRRMDTRVGDKIMRSGEPLSLSPVELQLDVYPLTRTPRPETVIAWVRYAWTPRAVAIKWPGPDDTEHRAWVWASAVDRL